MAIGLLIGASLGLRASPSIICLTSCVFQGSFALLIGVQSSDAPGGALVSLMVAGATLAVAIICLSVFIHVLREALTRRPLPRKFAARAFLAVAILWWLSLSPVIVRIGFDPEGLLMVMLLGGPVILQTILLWRLEQAVPAPAVP